ncbi:albusnodin/ikarugamycin family macrolactam cyclase [Streptomyces sp. NPDC048643]|uniref:albusnodin/ikarugamycin family macrolactam cyclase n=1 Tax=Streptomyces sp. NPDC048643 TaxID=3155637 RepID=UPI00342C3F50
MPSYETPAALADVCTPPAPPHSQSPTIAAVLSPAPSPPPNWATRVWPDERLLWSWGTWHPGEVRTAQCAQVRVVAVGQCLADDATMRQDLQRTVKDGCWERLTYWPGAYLLIVLPPDGGLTAYTDPAGQFPLYYAQYDGRTALSTRAGTAAALSGTSGQADSTVLAAHIVCPGVPELTEGRTAFAGVRQLGGGQALRVEPSGALQRWTYEDLKPDPDARFVDSAAQLRSALTRAVRLRSSGALRITSDFSGGMDSTSLAFLTARTTGRPLDAFVYHYPDGAAGDLEHALAYAAQASSIRLAVVQGNETALPYSDMHHQGPTDQPDPAAVIGARLRLRLERISQGGRSIHLTGEGGDALLAPPPSYLGDVAATVGLRRLLRDAGALARMRQLSPWKVGLRALRLTHTSVQKAMRDLAGQLEEPLQHPAQWTDAVAWWPAPGPETAWLTTKARRHLAEQAQECSRSAGTASAPTTAGHRAALCELRNSAAVQAQFAEAGRPFGIWPQAPFLDSEVVRACTRLALPCKADPFAAKPLLAAALTELVPGPVLQRKTKGDYSAEDYRGARRSAAQIKERLARSPLADLGIIEPSRVITSLDRAAAGLPIPFPALNRLLGVDMWLASRDSGKSQP